MKFEQELGGDKKNNAKGGTNSSKKITRRILRLDRLMKGKKNANGGKNGI